MNKKNGRRRDFGSLGHLERTIDGQEPVQDRNAVGVIETLLIMRREQIKKIRQKDSQSRRRVDPSWCGNRHTWKRCPLAGQWSLNQAGAADRVCTPLWDTDRTWRGYCLHSGLHHPCRVYRTRRKKVRRVSD
jgi:hypothetical protein